MKQIRILFYSILLAGMLCLPAFAAELGQPNITPQMTMKEIRENPSIAGCGISTYGMGDADSSYYREQSDKSTLEEHVGASAASDCAEGLNLAVKIYNAGVKVTWQLYSQEEIEADPSLGCVQLYYFPSDKPNSRYALVLGGNALRWSGELSEGIATVPELHEKGYTVFVLRYSTGTNLGDNRPLKDLGHAVQLITSHAQEFDVQTENYALIGYSSGGQLCGLFGSEQKDGYHAYDVPKPGAIILAYSVINFAEIKPIYQMLMDPYSIDWHYYWSTVARAVNGQYPPVYFWYGKYDTWTLASGYVTQWPAMKKALDWFGVPYEMKIYLNAPHGSGTGHGTDAEGWLNDAVAFWEEQCP